MAAHNWVHRIRELLTPAMVKRAQHDEIRNAIGEIQGAVITDVIAGDATIAVVVKGGSASIRATTTPGVSLEYHINTVQTFGAPVYVENVEHNQILIYDEENGAYITAEMEVVDVLVDLDYNNVTHVLRKTTQQVKAIKVGGVTVETITGGQAVPET